MSSAWRQPLRALATHTAIITMVGLGFAAPAAAAPGDAPPDLSQAQPESKADQNDGGANAGTCPEGPYCSTRDGSPSMNGNGGGEAKGKPCAGCVGKADNKNPRGQMPNGSDHNRGYECDDNRGIGRTNPAHTGCTDNGGGGGGGSVVGGGGGGGSVIGGVDTTVEKRKSGQAPEVAGVQTLAPQAGAAPAPPTAVAAGLGESAAGPMQLISQLLVSSGLLLLLAGAWIGLGRRRRGTLEG